MVIYKTFKTRKNKYVYDISTNNILLISDDEYQSLNKYNGFYDSTKCEPNSIFSNFQEKGFLLEHALEKLETPQHNIVNYMHTHKLNQIILQVTQNCNLRCEYCKYTGGYDNRQHTQNKMNKEIAFKSLNYALKHSDQTKQLIISFYGGEPLLNFDLIRECVNYIKNVVKDKKIIFSTTTNATLLTDEIVSFFVENNFKITVSLDGDKNAHDAHRIFPSGKGSFDIIMENLEKIYSKYPHYAESNIRFNTVMSPDIDLNKVDCFFKNNKILFQASCLFSLVDYNLADNNLIIPQPEPHIYLSNKFLLLKAYIELVNNKNITTKIYAGLKKEYYEKYKRLNEYSIMPRTFSRGGPCLIGSKRLFVSTDGTLYPCERICETSAPLKLGNIFKGGIDQQKALDLYNIGTHRKNCLNCWAIRHCIMCVSHFSDSTGINENREKKLCAKNKAEILNGFKQICSLQELGCKFTEEELL